MHAFIAIVFVHVGVFLQRRSCLCIFRVLVSLAQGESVECFLQIAALAWISMFVGHCVAVS